MTIRHIYEQSILGDYYWLQTLIEFLVLEKGTVSFDDDKSALDLYFKPNNEMRMNELLKEYAEGSHE